MTDLAADCALAEALASAAGEILLKVREAGLVEGKALGALGDQVANTFLTRALRELRSDDGLLSEEEAADPARITKSRVWIVDPLDGTREYSEGRADWAIHVALTVDGAPAASAVALPGLGVTYGSGAPPACPRADGPLKIVVSRTRPPEQASEVARKLGAELAPMGSAGAKSMAVVRGEAHAYIHAGGQYEWDSCAPVGVAAAAGLHVSRLDGSTPLYNQADPYMPDLLVCRPELAASILAHLKG